jgi:hypothetical protein
MPTTYATENLICGEIQTDQVKLKAGTYYSGMPLKYTVAADYYEYSATGSELAAIYLGNPQATSRVLSAAGYDAVIKGGQVFQDGFVNNSGAALTIDEDYIAAAAANGFYIKKK